MARNPFQAALWPAGLYRGGELVSTHAYADAALPLAEVFGREAPLLLEIGPGRGHFLIELALARPDWNVLGLEMSRKRCQSLAAKALRAGAGNVAVLNGIAELALGGLLPPGCAHELHVHFPDPWPKKRHHKRRMLGAAIVPRLVETLCPGGLLCAMTDHAEYAAEALQALETDRRLRNLAGAGQFASRPDEPGTYYHQLSVAAGRPIHYMRMQRTSAAEGKTC
jgi:tRNA (guanine-N7-)-methyltransferase